MHEIPCQTTLLIFYNNCIFTLTNVLGYDIHIKDLTKTSEGSGTSDV